MYVFSYVYRAGIMIQCMCCVVYRAGIMVQCMCCVVY